MKSIFLCIVCVCSHVTAGELIRTYDDPMPTGLDSFGNAIDVDGDHLLVGAQGDQGNGFFVGQAYLLDVLSGNLLQTFDDPTITELDYFGSSVAVEGDFAAIGARGDDASSRDGGQVYVFDVLTGDLLHTINDPNGNSSDGFGASMAMSEKHLLVGELGGNAHLFDVTTGNLLHTFTDPTGAGRDRFGLSVAIHGDYLVVGDGDDDTKGLDVGQAHIFDVLTGELIRTIDDPTITGGDRFGQSVAIEGDTVFVGAPGDSTKGRGFGQAHVFDVESGSLLQTFDDPTVDIGGGGFGSSVAIDDKHALVGAHFDDTKGGNVGQDHLFDVSTGELLGTLDDPTITESDSFGWSVALAGNRAFVGAFQDKTIAGDVGQVHVFKVPIPEPTTMLLLLVALVTLRAYRRSPANLIAV